MQGYSDIQDPYGNFEQMQQEDSPVMEVEIRGQAPLPKTFNKVTP